MIASFTLCRLISSASSVGKLSFESRLDKPAGTNLSMRIKGATKACITKVRHAIAVY